MGPKAVRAPTRRVAAAGPLAHRLASLLDAGHLYASSNPQLAATLGRRALELSDAQPAALPRGAANGMCARCGIPLVQEVYQSGQVVKLPHHLIRRQLQRAAAAATKGTTPQQANRAAVVYTCQLCGHPTVRPFYTLQLAAEAVHKAGGQVPGSLLQPQGPNGLGSGSATSAVRKPAGALVAAPHITAGLPITGDGAPVVAVAWATAVAAVAAVATAAEAEAADADEQGAGPATSRHTAPPLPGEGSAASKGLQPAPAEASALSPEPRALTPGVPATHDLAGADEQLAVPAAEATTPAAAAGPMVAGPAEASPAAAPAVSIEGTAAAPPAAVSEPAAAAAPAPAAAEAPPSAAATALTGVAAPAATAEGAAGEEEATEPRATAAAEGCGTAADSTPWQGAGERGEQPGVELVHVAPVEVAEGCALVAPGEPLISTDMEQQSSSQAALPLPVAQVAHGTTGSRAAGAPPVAGDPAPSATAEPSGAADDALQPLSGATASAEEVATAGRQERTGGEAVAHAQSAGGSSQDVAVGFHFNFALPPALEPLPADSDGAGQEGGGQPPTLDRDGDGDLVVERRSRRRQHSPAPLPAASGGGGQDPGGHQPPAVDSDGDVVVQRRARKRQHSPRQDEPAPGEDEGGEDGRRPKHARRISQTVSWSPALESVRVFEQQEGKGGRTTGGLHGSVLASAEGQHLTLQTWHRVGRRWHVAKAVLQRQPAPAAPVT